jgi:hypothetical protein
LPAVSRSHSQVCLICFGISLLPPGSRFDDIDPLPQEEQDTNDVFSRFTKIVFTRPQQRHISSHHWQYMPQSNLICDRRSHNSNMPSVKRPIRDSIAMFMSRRKKPDASMTVCSSSEDESSVTSTISVHRVPLHKHATATTITTTTTTTTKKTVCFNEACNASYNNTLVCKEDTVNLWYSTEELATFKVENNDLAKEITRSERDSIQAVYSYQRVIRRVYDACLKQPFDQDDDESSTLLLSSLLSPNDSTHLQKWLNCSLGRIGLERKSVRCIAKDVHLRRKDIYRMVLEIQEMDTTSSLEDKAEFLRKSCQALSRPSRLFAHELAVAQAVAVVTL